MLTTEQLVRYARRSIPSFKWIIGATALMMLAGVVVDRKDSLVTLCLGAGLLLSLGGGLILFGWMSKLDAAESSRIAVFLTWALLIKLMVWSSLLLSSAALDEPWPVRTWIIEQLKSDP